jgi:transposase
MGVAAGEAELGSPRHDGCVPSRTRPLAPEKKVRLPAVKKARVARKQVRVEPPVGRPPTKRRRFPSVNTPLDKRITKPLLFVGLDAHKETISIGSAEDGRSGEVRSHGTISNDLRALEKLLRKLQKEGPSGKELRVCYEAGPCGFAIARRLLQLGINCVVVAPSLIPKKSGDRQKNDRRDALKLARLHRSGDLTAIHIPEPTDEALRDLCRARTDAMNDLRRTRQQLKAQLLRLGYKYTGKTSWNEAHEHYLRALVLPHAAHQVVLEEYLQSISAAGERVRRLSGQIETLAKEWRLWPAVQALMCMRGFQVLSATLFLSELGDLRRFAHPTHLMAYLGLLPSEHSSGETVRKGAITKCGNSHVRWILIEAAHHYAHPPKVGLELSRRQEGQARRLKEISWSAQNRLYRRFRALSSRGKTTQKAITAVARELAGFLWAIYHECQQPGSIPARSGSPRPKSTFAAEGAATTPFTNKKAAPRDYPLEPFTESPRRKRTGACDGASRPEVVGSGGARSHR